MKSPLLFTVLLLSFLAALVNIVNGQADMFTSGTILQPWGGALGMMSSYSPSYSYMSYPSYYSNYARSGYNYNGYSNGYSSSYGNPYNSMYSGEF